MITGYISSKVIINRLYRDLGVNTEINESDLIEWTSDALRLIGAYGQYEEKSKCFELTNGKAELPCDFYKLVDIMWENKPLYWATNTNAVNYQCSYCNIPICDICDLNFYINDRYLITNINTTTTSNVCLVYLAAPIDEEGYPMIPDDIYYEKAIAAYVTYMLDSQAWRAGRIADKVFNRSEKEWLFYCPAAKGSANMPNTAQTENLVSIWQRLIPNPKAYGKNFKGFNRGEKRRIK